MDEDERKRLLYFKLRVNMIDKFARCAAFSVTIHIAGDIGIIESICHQYCTDVGLCVTVTPTKYIYKAGEETGARIGLINYPRFPEDWIYILDKAKRLAELVASACGQISYTIETPTDMYYYYDSELKPMPEKR